MERRTGKELFDNFKRNTKDLLHVPQWQYLPSAEFIVDGKPEKVGPSYLRKFGPIIRGVTVFVDSDGHVEVSGVYPSLKWQRKARQETIKILPVLLGRLNTSNN